MRTDVPVLKHEQKRQPGIMNLIRASEVTLACKGAPTPSLDTEL